MRNKLVGLAILVSLLGLGGWIFRAQLTEALHHLGEQGDAHGHADHEDHAGHDDHSEAGHQGHDEHEGEQLVRLSREALQELGIKLAKAEPGELAQHVDLPGEVRTNPDRTVHVVPRVDGVAVEVRSTLGLSVKAGDVLAVLESARLGEAKIEFLGLKQKLELAQLDLTREKTVHQSTERMIELLKKSPTLEALQEQSAGQDMGAYRSQLISAYAKLRLMQDLYQQEQKLLQQKVTSRAEYLKAESAYKEAKAHYTTTLDQVAFTLKRQHLEKERTRQLAESNLQAAHRRLRFLGVTEQQVLGLSQADIKKQTLSRIELRAPIAGVVIQKHIARGEVVKSDQDVFVIANLSSVWINLSVYLKDLPRVKLQQPVRISARGARSGVMARIDYLSAIVDEKTRTATARVVLPNKHGNWRPGLFVDARVTVATHRVLVRVARSALQTVDNQSCLFVEQQPGVFELRKVKTGRRSETHVEILQGLRKGERYVERGAFTLKAQLAKGSFGDGHNH